MPIMNTVQQALAQFLMIVAYISAGALLYADICAEDAAYGYGAALCLFGATVCWIATLHAARKRVVFVEPARGF